MPAPDTLKVFPDARRARAACASAAPAEACRSLPWLLDTWAAEEGAARAPERCLRALVAGLAMERPGGPFGAYARSPGFARAAHALFEEAKHGLLTPERFRDCLEELPAEKRGRAVALAGLFGAYEARLQALRWHDAADLWRLCAGGLEKGLPAVLEPYARVELHGLYCLTPLQRELFIRLAAVAERHGRELELRVPSGGSPATDVATDALFAAFEAHPALPPQSISKELPASSARAALAAALFDPRGRPVPGAAGELELFRSSGPRQEAREVARRIHAWVEQGVAPGKMAVVSPAPAPEAAFLADALRERGIPAERPGGTPLSSTPAGRSALGFARLAEQGFPAEAVARLLDSGVLPALSAGLEGGSGALLAEAGVRDDVLGAHGGRGAYELRLGALARRLKARGRDRHAARVQALGERVERLRAAAQLPARAELSAFLAAWWGGLEALGGLGSGPGRPWADAPWALDALRGEAEQAAAAEAVSALSAELAWALERTGLGKARVSRAEFAAWLSDAFEDVRVPAPGGSADAVQVLGLDELPGLPLERLWIAGLLDGQLPRRRAGNPLFGDEERAQVNRLERRDAFRLQAGEPGAREAWDEAEGRLLFALALTAPACRVGLSFAPRPGSGEALASPWVEELVRRSGLEVPMAGGALLPPLEAVGTEAELRLCAAHALGADPAPRGGAARALGRRLLDEPWLTRALGLGRMEAERLFYATHPEAPAGPFTGLLGEPDLEPILTELFRFDSQRPVSASTLSRYGNCGFQGLLAHGLHLGERERPSETMDVRSRGSYWHLVFEHLFPMLARAGLLGVPYEALPEGLLNDALALAARRAEEELHVGHPAVWRVAQGRARLMLQRLLSTDHRGLPFGGHEPWRSELKFGAPAAEEGWREVVVAAGPGEAPIHLEGKIDRLDRAEGALGIVDYKAGRVDPGALAGGLLTTQLQIPVYLFAAKASGHEGGLDAAWVSLRAGEAVTLGEVLKKAEVSSLDELLSDEPEVRRRLDAEGRPNLANALHGLVRRLRSGELGMRSEDCGRCSFQAVCRVGGRAEGALA